MTTPTYCTHCGAELYPDNYHSFNASLLCDHCFNTQTVVCDCCSDRIWLDDAEGDTHITLCRYCYDNQYSYCTDCGRLIHNDAACYSDNSDDPYCTECYDKLYDSYINSYHYKPEPIFYGSGSLFMGVELEVDEGGENTSNAKEILELANYHHEHIYCKHDGSLHNGFEIVSHPMTLDYHTHEMNWREVMAKAVSIGYISHNANTCGLHIHCNRDFFGTTVSTQENAIGRVVYFVEKHWNELVKCSRRTSYSLERWAAKYATISETAQATYDKAKHKGLGRYVAVNLANHDTIEFRLFRGTLRYETFLATLQLVEEICSKAKYLMDYEMETLSWSDFVQQIDGQTQPELVQYLKTRRLYVNEEITESEEM